MGANNIHAQDLSVPKVLTGICADGHILEWDRGRTVLEAVCEVAVHEIVVELFAEIFNLSAGVVPESRRIRNTLAVALVLGTEALHGVEGV